MPHYSTTYLDAPYCYKPSSVVCLSISQSVCLSVCLSVCHSHEPCKDGWTDRDAIWVVQKRPNQSRCYLGCGLGWIKDGGPDHPMWRVNFWHAWACPATLCRELCKNDWTDRDAVWVANLDEPKKGCVTWGHIGAAWRIRLSHPCVAAMQSFCQITLTTCYYSCVFGKRLLDNCCCCCCWLTGVVFVLNKELLNGLLLLLPLLLLLLKSNWFRSEVVT